MDLQVSLQEGAAPRSTAWWRMLCGVVSLALVAALVTVVGAAPPQRSPPELHLNARLPGIRSIAPVLPRAAATGAKATPTPWVSTADPISPTLAASRPSLALDANPADGATLYDMPVSNHGARVRLVLYWTGLEDRVSIRSPMDVGGLKSPEFLTINPQGKMPALVLRDGTALAESEVISQFLLDSYPDIEPRLSGQTPLHRAHIHLLTRFHDLYLAPVQGAMYRAMAAEERCTGLQQIHQQLRILEDRTQAPYLTGTAPTTADAAIFSTAVFLNFILPRHFGWAAAFEGCPRLAQWFDTMSKDPQGARVRAEVEGGLAGWEASKRWDALGITAQVQGSGLKFAPPFA